MNTRVYWLNDMCYGTEKVSCGATRSFEGYHNFDNPTQLDKLHKRLHRSLGVFGIVSAQRVVATIKGRGQWTLNPQFWDSRPPSTTVYPSRAIPTSSITV